MAIETINPNIGAEAPAGKSELDILNEDDKVEDFKKDEDPGDEDEKDEKDDEKVDDEDTEDKDDKDEDDKDDDEDDEQKDNEEDDEESDDEESDDEPEDDEDLEASLYKRLKKDTPDLFKKHPELKHVIFREERYAKLFPTVEEAQEASERIEVFSKMEADILSGNPKELLASVEKTDKKAFDDFVHNFLPALFEQSKDKYISVLELPLKRAVQNLYVQAKKSGNKNLMNAALYVDDFWFEGDGIGKDPASVRTKKEDKKSPEVERLEKERDEHANRIRGEFNDSVIEQISHKLMKEITASIQSFEFDPYKRKNVSRDIETEVNTILSRDERYQAGVRSLYKQAESARFDSNWKLRIINAFLTRAKAVLPLAKKKVIEEATGKKLNKEKKRIVPTNLASHPGKTLRASDIDRTKTTDLDVLNDNVTLKGK